ncbi:MAG: hypothetical protein IPF70_12990 [Saprospiraceae bacterium]|nr:hypothetical protein [Saprospiraceae bacterium]
MRCDHLAEVTPEVKINQPSISQSQYLAIKPKGKGELGNEFNPNPNADCAPDYNTAYEYQF